MKTSSPRPADLSASVLAVPPLARDPDLNISEPANEALIRYVEDGGVATLMYGGNANFYHIPLSEYAQVLDFLAATVDARTWVIPSAGPDYGRLMDQAEILRRGAFPTVMVLPLSFPATPAGVARAIRDFADRIGRRVILYLKSETYLPIGEIGSLVADDVVFAIKYAIVREKPEEDPFLKRLLGAIDRQFVISGIGERPAIAHMTQFGLVSFTSGSVCVAPRTSKHLLEALLSGDIATARTIREVFLPLEDLRDAINPIRVLHAAVKLAGIADTGPILPMLHDLDAVDVSRVREAASRLMAEDRALTSAVA